MLTQLVLSVYCLSHCSILSAPDAAGDLEELPRNNRRRRAAEKKTIDSKSAQILPLSHLFLELLCFQTVLTVLFLKHKSCSVVKSQRVL